MAKRISIGSKAVATAIVTEAVYQALHPITITEMEIMVDRGAYDEIAAKIATALVDMASGIEYKPNAERLVITLDAGMADEPTS